MNPSDLDFADNPDATDFSPQIKGSERRAVVGYWIGALVPLGFLLFVTWKMSMPVFFLKPGVPNPFTGILLLVSAIFLFRAVWETVRLQRFGDPILGLTRVPVPLGGMVDGRIDFGSRVTNAPDFNVRLQCIRRVLQSNGKNSHYVETVLWTGEKTASLLPGGLVPVSIAVPPDQQESSSLGMNDSILWRLTVAAPFRGVKFLEKYEIPVQGRTAAVEKIEEERARSGSVSVTPMTKKKAFVAMLPFLLVGVAILAGGVYLLKLGVSDVTRASASSGWPTVAGQVRYSVAPRGKAAFVHWDDSDFAYTYSVNGTVYTGHVVYPRLLWTGSAVAKSVQTYPTGAVVTVHYSPANPASSCLEPGLRTGAFQRLVMALLVLAVGVLFAGSALFAPRDAELRGNTWTFRNGTTGSKLMGYSFLAVIVLGVALWWVS